MLNVPLLVLSGCRLLRHRHVSPCRYRHSIATISIQYYKYPSWGHFTCKRFLAILLLFNFFLELSYNIYFKSKGHNSGISTGVSLVLNQFTKPHAGAGEQGTPPCLPLSRDATARAKEETHQSNQIQISYLTLLLEPPCGAYSLIFNFCAL